ncbi:MAG: SMC-Scp complex subunit ScpB [Candidatus Omnitrophica bacterium]|nr:SMC-Scp complex subunit ScpB [Candidatus Omnitrophota bacterium]
MMDMNEMQVKQIIEALLFVCEKPLTLKQIQEVCSDFELTQVRLAIKSLQEDYNNSERGIQVTEVAGGYQFATHPDCAEHIKKLYKTRRIFRLSAPALETVAIIAYKQPITRAEIEFIRGVNVDGVVKTLEERGLIKEKGRKEVPGKPILYGTTEEFLHYFGLKSVDELPSLESYIDTLSKHEENMAKSEEEIKVQDQSPENTPAQEEPDLPQDLTKAEQYEATTEEGEVKNEQSEHSESAKSN